MISGPVDTALALRFETAGQTTGQKSFETSRVMACACWELQVESGHLQSSEVSARSFSLFAESVVVLFADLQFLVCATFNVKYQLDLHKLYFV